MFEVLSTSGDTHLGGDDFDKRIVDFLADDFKANEGMDLRKDRQALQRLTEAAEKAKMELSSTPQTTISLPFITATADGPKHIEATLTRSKFEQICTDLLDRCRIPVEQALKDAKLQLSEINEVCHGQRFICCRRRACSRACVLQKLCASQCRMNCLDGCFLSGVCAQHPVPRLTGNLAQVASSSPPLSLQDVEVRHPPGDQKLNIMVALSRFPHPSNWRHFQLVYPQAVPWHASGSAYLQFKKLQHEDNYAEIQRTIMLRFKGNQLLRLIPDIETS